MLEIGNAKIARWKLAYLSGALGMLAGVVEFLPFFITLSRHGDPGRHVSSIAFASLGTMFLAVGGMWLAIGSMWKRKAANNAFLPHESEHTS